MTTPDAALLVELTVTKRRQQFLDVLRELRTRGWNIVSTPRDGEFGVGPDGQADRPVSSDRQRPDLSTS